MVYPPATDRFIKAVGGKVTAQSFDTSFHDLFLEPVAQESIQGLADWMLGTAKITSSL